MDYLFHDSYDPHWKLYSVDDVKVSLSSGDAQVEVVSQEILV